MKMTGVLLFGKEFKIEHNNDWVKLEQLGLLHLRVL